ncbi:MAG: AAA family ATPase, partial [Acinetobacter pseudolwoffii]|nr:AAA family ATPase [Acinetobacter pseudolwoffii]
SLGYPSRHAEKLLLQQESRFALIASLAHIFTEDEILDLQSLAHQVFMSEAIQEYLLDLAEETRKNRHGLSTRGLLALKRAAQAHALIQQRAFVTADDVQAVFVAVTSHRLGLSEAETLNVMQQVAVS